MPKPVRRRVKIPIRTSERKDFMQCQWRWYMSYVKGWKAKRPSNALVFGDLVHQALGGTDKGEPGYYIPETLKRRRRGPHPANTFKMLVERSGVDFNIRDEDEDLVNMLELGQEMLTNYVNKYGKDHQWLLLYPEMPLQVDVYTEEGLYICTYVGKTDALVQDMNTMDYGLLEHKTAKSIPKGTLWNNEQGTSYWTFVPAFLWEHGILPRDQDMTFMVFNFLRKGMMDHRPENAQGAKLNKPSKTALQDRLTELGVTFRKADKVEDLEALLRQKGVDPAQLGEVSKTQPTPLFERKLVRRGIPERQHLLNRVIAQAADMSAIREGLRAPYKEPGDHCDWCALRNVCELHEIGADWKEMLSMEFVQWDPYADHREVVY